MHGRSQEYQIRTDYTPSHEGSVKTVWDLNDEIWRGYFDPVNIESQLVDLTGHQHIRVGSPNVSKH
jgi:hypothetical protein